MASCPNVENDRGQSTAAPCVDYCGPLDLHSWYQAAERELQTAQSWRPWMDAAEITSHDALLAAYHDLPPRAGWAVVDKTATTYRAANLAQTVRCLWSSVEARHRAPTTDTTSPTTDTTSPPWNWQDWLPGLPAIPGLPGFPLPDFGELLPWLVLGGAALLMFSPARAASRYVRRDR